MLSIITTYIVSFPWWRHYANQWNVHACAYNNSIGTCLSAYRQSIHVTLAYRLILRFIKQYECTPFSSYDTGVCISFSIHHQVLNSWCSLDIWVVSKTCMHENCANCKSTYAWPHLLHISLYITPGAPDLDTCIMDKAWSNKSEQYDDEYYLLGTKISMINFTNSASCKMIPRSRALCNNIMTL